MEKKSSTIVNRKRKFHYWSRKSYASFCSIKRYCMIGVLHHNVIEASMTKHCNLPETAHVAKTSVSSNSSFRDIPPVSIDKQRQALRTTNSSNNITYRKASFLFQKKNDKNIIRSCRHRLMGRQEFLFITHSITQWTNSII